MSRTHMQSLEVCEEGPWDCKMRIWIYWMDLCTCWPLSTCSSLCLQESQRQPFRGPDHTDGQQEMRKYAIKHGVCMHHAYREQMLACLPPAWIISGRCASIQPASAYGHPLRVLNVVRASCMTMSSRLGVHSKWTGLMRVALSCKQYSVAMLPQQVTDDMQHDESSTAVTKLLLCKVCNQPCVLPEAC